MAKDLLNDIGFSLISFMYIRNMRGPNTDLWGTPAETGSKLDQEFLLITFCLLTEILFFPNTGNIDNIEFSFNGKSIPLSTSHKHLGVILSQNAKWNEHLENMITNITKHLGILRKLKFRKYSGAIPHFILKNNWSFLRYLRSDSVSQPVSAYKYSDFVKMGNK
jgi:hypothetical protein